MKYEIETNSRNIPDIDLLADLRRVAGFLNKNKVSTREYNQFGKYRSNLLRERFGGWANTCNKAGLNAPMIRNITEEALFENLEEVWEKLGKQPRFRDMKSPISKHSAASYLARYGTWIKALEAFINKIELLSENLSGSTEISDEKPELGNVSKHKTKRNVNYRLRFLILRRDNFKCVICGQSPATNSSIILHIDHVIAWEKGGETVSENLQTLCSICNIGKSNLNFRND